MTVFFLFSSSPLRTKQQLHSDPARLISTSAGKSCRKLPGDSRTSSRSERLSSRRTAPRRHTEGEATDRSFLLPIHASINTACIRMYEIYICTVGTWPNFFSHIGSRLACSFSRTSWRAPSCEETKKGRKKKTLNELKCYEGKHSRNVQIKQIPLQCYIIIYHIVLYNEQILFKITQIGQIKVNKSFFSSEQKLECKNLKCVDF